MRVSSLATLGLSGLGAVVSAATVTYDWTIDWVRAAPDGFSRPVIGVNNKWPCPPIRAAVGDTVVVKIKNNLGNQTTGLHFHGINQIATNEMDGASGVTQCPLPPGDTLTYQFVADAPGTYWYHSHTMGQYPDGLRGPLIIDDPNDPYKGKYDEEVILSVSDWYHSETLALVRNMLSPSNTRFAPPFPNSIIVNEGGDGKYNFVKGKTYRFRVINFGAFASAMLQFDSHTMEIIMNDGAYVKQEQAYQIRISPSQRFDVLISCIERDHRNYPIFFSLDQNRDFELNPTWPLNFTGHLVMDSQKALTQFSVPKWNPHNDAHLKPYNDADILPNPDQVIKLDFTFCRDVNGYPRACFNNQTYIPQKTPVLYTAATVGEHNTNPLVYGQVLPFIVPYGRVVDIVVNNIDAAIHPFHLHGHHFQVLERPGHNAGVWQGRSHGFNKKPPMRDVVHVNANSYAVLRFKANNPGVFLFHCHIEWHVEMGLTATIIEAPERLRGKTFPSDHTAACQKQGRPLSGNAAGNMANPLDTTGFVTVPDTVYNGAMYTPIVAPRRHRAVRDLSF
ncbi:iron transport multicopper oxidase FET3 [Gaeumannomyces tritici R3-111a-1]|uniref:Iron transport multicopper oxidase FET3 n=1 Tax=Gaeumannomyces tritici (strain R3-111a-1) TaxID=644352 RepID=J3NGL5_GAET3|nr:iron transport multicopper oxidase FET3 [Gaeumannomyces tritici R3-111a-1]EJT80405.1 iron transport multicopper oxidase FET3 [Gaeumannomyces tritici R3-111a-1]